MGGWVGGWVTPNEGHSTLQTNPSKPPFPDGPRTWPAMILRLKVEDATTGLPVDQTDLELSSSNLTFPTITTRTTAMPNGATVTKEYVWKDSDAGATTETYGQQTTVTITTVTGLEPGPGQGSANADGINPLGERLDETAVVLSPDGERTWVTVSVNLTAHTVGTYAVVASLVGPEASAYAFANGTDRTVIRVSGEWRWGSGGLGGNPRRN